MVFLGTAAACFVLFRPQYGGGERRLHSTRHRRHAATAHLDDVTRPAARAPAQRAPEVASVPAAVAATTTAATTTTTAAGLPRPIVPSGDATAEDDACWRMVEQKHVMFTTKPATPPGSGDIYMLLPHLKRYASEPDVQHITEIGTRHHVSTWSLLAGKPKVYRGHDLARREAVDAFERDMSANCKHLDWRWTEGDDLKTPIEDTDLLFLDTWHTFRQLYAELNLLHVKARKYIIMHDTNGPFKNRDEGISGHASLPEDTALFAGLPQDVGLAPAVERFLAGAGAGIWKTKKHHLDNNGLWVLERV